MDCWLNKPVPVAEVPRWTFAGCYGNTPSWAGLREGFFEEVIKMRLDTTGQRKVPAKEATYPKALRLTFL